MLNDQVINRIEAESLSYNTDHINIFSNNGGPKDGGKKGHGGKGITYVWATDNGGMRNDDCSYDGYMDRIYTLSVSSVTEDDTSSWYAGKCPDTLTLTFSNG
ncbi:hypothetical protein LOAG_10068 [Loa loa]|uniref:Aegerolysin n=1 Tax=Loa loa TaxID=7209 RepID=A0A1I7W5B8_LOALO|nr:hypothetical protein LOAG_10068 [Loa loa]EFO18428.1 hypothetical protein LOAG_10068 [Loa loa]